MKQFKLTLAQKKSDFTPGEGNTLDKPFIGIVGSGPNTYLWVGDDRRCFSFTGNSTVRLRKFAESILKRLAKP